MTWEPCVSCARLSKCGEVDALRISAGEGCSLHETVHEGVVRARLRIMDDFGASAIPTKQNVKDGVIVMGAESMVKKVTLRRLGYRLGVVPRGSESFKLKEEDLFKLISPKYSNIRDMTEDQVEALIGSLSDEAPEDAAPPTKVEEKAPPAKAPKAPPVQQEPDADEESDEPEEVETPKPAAKRGPSARKPAAPAPQPAPAPAPAPRLEQQPEQVAPPRKAPVRPGAPAAKQAAAPSESGPSNTARLEEMLTVIGTAGDARDEKINALTVEIAKLMKLVKALSEDVRVIDSYLTYQYNGTVGEDDALTQLSDVDPWVG